VNQHPHLGSFNEILICLPFQFLYDAIPDYNN